jgi:hypothetical protein
MTPTEAEHSPPSISMPFGPVLGAFRTYGRCCNPPSNGPSFWKPDSQLP